MQSIKSFFSSLLVVLAAAAFSCPAFAVYDFVSIDYPGAASTDPLWDQRRDGRRRRRRCGRQSYCQLHLQFQERDLYDPDARARQPRNRRVRHQRTWRDSRLDVRWCHHSPTFAARTGCIRSSRTRVRAYPSPGEQQPRGWSPDTMSMTPPTPTIRSFTIPATTRSSTSSRASTASTLPRASTTKARSSAVFFWMRALPALVVLRAVMGGCAIQAEPFHFSRLMVRTPLLAASQTPASSPASSIPASGGRRFRYPADGLGLVPVDYNPRRSIAGGRPGGIRNRSASHQQRRHDRWGLE